MLFADLFKFHCFSHSLYGSKPISLTDYYVENLEKDLNIQEYCESILNRETAPINCYLNGWKAWEKYRSLFPLNDFILTKNQISNSESILIILINKHAFIETVNENINIFKSILGNHVTSENLLKEIENQATLLELLKYNNRLLGILLGYGDSNAQLFEKREEIYDFLSGKKLYLDLMTNSKDFDKVHEGLETIQSKLKLFNPLITLHMENTLTPSFLADPDHPETIKLQKQYGNLRPLLMEVLNRKDWFELILSKLTSN